MRYTVEDTREGFRLTARPAPPGPARKYDERGSHGPLAALFTHAEQAYKDVRERERTERES